MPFSRDGFKNQTIAELAMQAEKELEYVTRLVQAFNRLPVTMFLKKVVGRNGSPLLMVSINDTYERVWQVSRHDYEGHYDAEVWPEEVAEQFAKNDWDAIRQGEVWTVERTPGGRSGGVSLVCKIRLDNSDGTPWGIAGLAIPLDDQKLAGAVAETLET